MYSNMVDSILELIKSDDLFEPQVRSDEVENFILDLLVQCPFCSYVNTSQIELRDHIHDEHADHLVPSELTDNSHHSVEFGTDRIFLCPYCTYAVGSISGDKDTSYIVTHVSHCASNPTKSTHGLAKVKFKVSTDQDLIDSIIAERQQGNRYHCSICENLVFGSPEALLNHYFDTHSTATLSSLPDDVRQAVEEVVFEKRSKENQPLKLSCLGAEPNATTRSTQDGSQPLSESQEIDSLSTTQRPTLSKNSLNTRDADICNHILSALASTPVPVHVRVLHSDVSESFLINLGELELLLREMEGKRVESNGQYWRLLENEEKIKDRIDVNAIQTEVGSGNVTQESSIDVEEDEDKSETQNTPNHSPQKSTASSNREDIQTSFSKHEAQDVDLEDSITHSQSTRIVNPPDPSPSESST